MAGIYRQRDIRIVIDGYPLSDLMECSIDSETNTLGPFLSDVTYTYAAGRTRISLRTVDNIELAFDVHDKSLVSNSGYEMVQDENTTTIYVYGPLRKLIPSLFVDKDLLPWQLDYLRHMKVYHLRFKYWRSDPFFEDITALYFQHGYEHGKKAGYETGNREGYSKGRKDEQEYQKRERNNDRKTTSKR